MATIYSDASWTGTYTYTRVKVDYDYSSTRATATLLYSRTNNYSGATTANGATFTFGDGSTRFSKTFYGKQTDAVVASLNFNYSLSGGTYSGSSNGSFLGGSWSVTIPAASIWNDINAYKPDGSTQNGLIFDLKTSDGGSWKNLTNEPENFSRIKGTTATISNIRPNVTGAHYTKNSVTNNNASSVTWTFNSANYVVHLYSAWNTYTIAYNANGGSGAPGNQTKTYGTNLTLSSTKPSRTGYTFLGWSTNKSATSATYAAGAVLNKDLSTTQGATITLYAIWSINSYYLDLNGWLDGASSGGINGYGTVDVTVGGVLKGNDVTDYYSQHTYGSSYSITDIKATTGHTYNGVRSGSTSGTITGTTSVVLSFSTNSYNNYCQCWTWGYKNGEGNNGSRNAFHIGDTSWSGKYGTSVAWTADKAKASPNGFTMRNSIGSSSHSGSWTSYNLPYTFTQPAKECYAEYDYDPVSYSITYTMNGGTNNSSNPSSYNVLYGVTFGNPTRSGYDFKGWTIGGNAVTGINPGANASFSSIDDLYNKCASRTTGNKTVVANWLETKPSNVRITNYNATGPFSIDLSWSATGLNISNYTVYYRPIGTSSWLSKNVGTSTSTSLTVNEETTYEFFVRATNPGGTGDSSTVTVTTPADQAKIRIKQDGVWKKGKTYYKKDGQWVKAKKIYIKVDGQWKINNNYDS